MLIDFHRESTDQSTRSHSQSIHRIYDGIKRTVTVVNFDRLSAEGRAKSFIKEKNRDRSTQLRTSYHP